MSEDAVGIESQARQMGWAPEGEYKGDPAKWVDAQTWVDRGQNYIPIMKRDNERLRAEVARLSQLVQNSQESMEELRNVHQEATAKAVAQAKKDVMAAIKEARELGDVDTEMQLTDELADLRTAEREAENAKKQTKQTKTAPNEEGELDPDLIEWMRENPWLKTDQRKAARAVGIAQELRGDPDLDHLVGRPFYDMVTQVMEERYGQKQDFSKVGGTRSSSSSSSGGGKSYADLPADAKAECLRQGRKLVGEGRSFKTEKDWQSYYAKLYFGE